MRNTARVRLPQRLALVVLLSGLFGYEGGAPAAVPTPPTTRPSRIAWADDHWFLLGVNYPWLHYGHDFGATAWGHDGASSGPSRKQIDDDFAFLKKQGVHVVRWFLFGDGRASPEFGATGRVTGFDDSFYLDFETAIGIAEKHDIYLIPVLLDFHLCDKAKDVNGVQLGGRSQVIADPEKRQSFLERALIPLLKRYGNHRHIIAWDVMNEPEGALDVPGGRWVEDPVALEAMQTFVKDAVACIHAHTSQHATVGSASRGSLGYWKSAELDFYQYHYYDKMEEQHPLDYPCALLGLDKPCIVGEFPTRNTKRVLSQYLSTIYNNGYAGALAWSFRAEDAASDFKRGADEMRAWSERYDRHVHIGGKEGEGRRREPLAVGFPYSADGRYKATLTASTAGSHYQVEEVATGRLVLTTRAQYDTPNDVKVGGFSPDSKRFAAVYHYGHEGSYTWIGVWSTETGEFLYSKRKPGWTRSLAEVFDE